MKRLLGVERRGRRITRDWLHTDNDRRLITVETVEDVEPVVESVKRLRDNPDTPIGRTIARIPGAIVMQAANVNAVAWGISSAEAYREIAQGKSDRAQGVWQDLLYGRDYRKFQVKE